MLPRTLVCGFSSNFSGLRFVDWYFVSVKNCGLSVLCLFLSFYFGLLFVFLRFCC